MRLEELPKWAVPAACGTVAFGVGTLVGRWLTNRRYVKVVSEETTEDIQLAFDFDTTDLEKELNKAVYTIRKMRDESENLMSNVRDLAILKDIPVSPSRENHPSNVRPKPEDIVIAIKEEEEGGEVVHVFKNTIVDDGWDYEVELQKRDPRYPYIIHHDEFFNDEMGYGAAGDQRTLTWYAQDEILTDEQDVPVFNQFERVGTLIFGHGSGDENIVYVRNEKEEEEYEIVLDDGAYQVVVLGGQLEAEMAEEDIRHSRSPGKFRVVD